jgi:N-acetylneuraminic acid mutarotase
MVVMGKDIYLFGGQGRTMFEELRLIDTTHKLDWNWVLLDTGDVTPKKKDGESTPKKEEGGEVADRPGPRTATVFSRWGDKLILFGGSGPYISHIKSRRSYYDIYLFDTKTKRWNQNKTKIKGKQSLNKRINHAGDVLGSILAIYGGYDSESKEILDDLVLYDIEEHAWVDADIRYLKNEQGKIGRRSKLTVTSVFFNGSGMFNDA